MDVAVPQAVEAVAVVVLEDVVVDEVCIITAITTAKVDN